MAKFVVYEVWTRWREVEAEDVDEAYVVGEPEPRDDLSLCNWHVAAEPVLPAGGLNASN